MYIKNRIAALLLIILLLLSGCAKKTYTPVLETRFDLNADYKMGDFSYSCRIVKSENSVSITPTSSYAKGMTIKFDGKKLSFAKSGIKTREFEREDIDSTNPAVVLYEVFSSIENTKPIEVSVKKSGFHYVGTTSVGTFSLIQGKSGELKSISVPDASIEIIFT